LASNPWHPRREAAGKRNTYLRTGPAKSGAEDGLTGADWDVAIIGAGAAGCAAAISLPAGARAILVDRGVPGVGRCCGGLLAPDGRRALEDIGLRLPESVRVEPEPHLVRVHDMDSGLQQTYRRRYCNLDRARFDAWLLDQAARRADFRPRTRLVALEQSGAAWRVRLASGGREESVTTGLVIGADGAASSVRRLAMPNRPGPRTMLAMQVRLETDRPPAAHLVLFASRLTDFYAWAIPKPGSVLVGCAFSRPRGANWRFREILLWYARSLGVAPDAVERSARRLSRPAARAELFAGAGGALLAGEAAGLVSPSSGEGLSLAIESGAAAGRAVAAEVPQAAYDRAFRRPARRVALKLIKARVIFSPLLRRLALRLPWCP
jgi:flavin-dependent dehydrogenase